MQKKLPLINSAHGSETRNIINELIKLFNGMGYTYDEALQKAHKVLKEAERVNKLNNNTNTRLDKIIADSGTSSTEVVDARGDHTVLSKRLNESEAFSEESFSYMMEEDNIQKALPVTPKIIQNVGGVILVISRKPHGKGYIRFKLMENKFTTNVSIGSPAELYRVVEVFEVDECFSFKHAARVDNTSDWTTLSVNYTKVGVGQQSLPVRSTVNRAVGKWIEYDINVPQGKNEITALIYKTGGSSNDVDVSVNGENVLTGQNFSGEGFEKIVIPVGYSGNKKIRFKSNTVQHLNIAGVNVTNIQDYVDGTEYDTVLSLVVSASRQYVTSDGAMEYALLDGDTNIWCGSYHGGESRKSIKYILDGEKINLRDGDVKIGRVFEVEQETNINNKIDSFHIERFEGDGSVEHETVFEGDINLTTLFINMATATDEFNEILYPIKSDMSDMANNDRVYLPQGITSVVQRNKDTFQKVTTIMSNKKLPVDAVIVPYIRKTVGAYNKLYFATIQSDTPVNFTGGNFKTKHIFE